MQRQRLNKHTTLFLGPVSKRDDPRLRFKASRDRMARMYNLAPPEIYHISNIQSRPPRSEHMPIPKHRKPLHHIPEARGHTRYVRGSALHNQAVHRQIQELAKLVH